MLNSQATIIDQILQQVVNWQHTPPTASLPSELDELFQDLRAERPLRPPFMIEDRIWELWTTQPDPTLVQAMEQSIAAIAERRLTDAERRLSALVERAPMWAEAWNKRATLRFLDGRDADSLEDIQRTVALEPRHFGSMSGFAQICLRRGRADAAMVALQVALAINPHLDAAAMALSTLKARQPTLH